MDSNTLHYRRRGRNRFFLQRCLPPPSKFRLLRNTFFTAVIAVLFVEVVLLPILRSLLGVSTPGWMPWIGAFGHYSHKHCYRSLSSPYNSTQARNQTIKSIENITYFTPLGLININSSDPEATYRSPDTTDAFATYKYRDHPFCSLSSLDLHLPFSPLCADRTSFLTAFSSGGRIGFDSPYAPLACDMRWFTTSETCSVMSRFDKVVFVGDSMMRHVVGAMNVILREDLGYGAVTGWNFADEEMEGCFCMHQMDVKACSVQGIYRTSDVLKNDAESWACGKRTKKVNTEDGKVKVETTSDVNLIIELMLRFPLDPDEVDRFKKLLPSKRPKKAIAFVFGHGLWNDLDLQALVHWLNGVLQAIYQAAPYLRPEALPREVIKDGLETTKPLAHVLFITPSAAGILKPDQWVQSQGNKALQVFEESVHNLVHREDGLFYNQGIEHMGTWNMSIQMYKWDGVHLDLKGNLIKAMGVINWLNGIDVEKWAEQGRSLK